MCPLFQGILRIASIDSNKRDVKSLSFNKNVQKASADLGYVWERQEGREWFILKIEVCTIQPRVIFRFLYQFLCLLKADIRLESMKGCILEAESTLCWHNAYFLFCP